MSCSNKSQSNGYGLTLLIGFVFSSILSSCINPNQPNSGYYGISREQAENNRAYTHQIEADSQQFRHDERMSQAQANELSTRNAPRSVTRTTIIPFFY
jgi:hypothetical protein